MANSNAPFGFRQTAGLGAAPTYEQSEYSITSTAGAIFFGDPVQALADGSVSQAPSSTGAPPAGGIAGIFVGCKYLSIAQKRTVWGNYWPGSDGVAGTVFGYICQDPDARFVVQTDGTGAALADVNGTFGFVIGSGNTANGISGAYLDMSTGSATANQPFKVMSIVNFPPGAQGTLSNGQPYDWVVVMFNNMFTRSNFGI